MVRSIDRQAIPALGIHNNPYFEKGVDLKPEFMENGLLISCFLVIMALLYLRYRTRQKNNRLLQARQEQIDVTSQELHRSNDQQQKLLAEKEWLLKEIHHRVRNNLQIVISLLNAQSDFLDNPSALQAIRESRERMQAIALIHQKLYQPDNSTLIDMRSYIQEMVAYLENSITDKDKISFQLAIEDSKLDVSQAIPLGLILNEAVTNAIRHAFPADRRGIITIALQQPSSPNILLTINDNGQGLPPGFDLSRSNSLGIQLMKLFAEQLEGEIQFHSEKGVEISVTFKQQPASGFFPAIVNEGG